MFHINWRDSPCTNILTLSGYPIFKSMLCVSYVYVMCVLRLCYVCLTIMLCVSYDYVMCVLRLCYVHLELLD